MCVGSAPLAPLCPISIPTCSRLETVLPQCSIAHRVAGPLASVAMNLGDTELEHGSKALLTVSSVALESDRGFVI